MEATLSSLQETNAASIVIIIILFISQLSKINPIQGSLYDQKGEHKQRTYEKKNPKTTLDLSHKAKSL